MVHILPINQLPKGTLINVEENAGNHSMLARMLGNYATIISHSPDDNETQIRLPSSAKRTDSRSARASVGIVAGGVHISKPLLKASHTYHKFKANHLDVSAATSHSSSCSLSPSSPSSFVLIAADMDIDIDYHPISSSIARDISYGYHT